MTLDNLRPVAGTALRVLVVEDSAEDGEIMLDELRDAGYLIEHLRVETMGALRAALSAGAWQLILCDYTLPTFDASCALGAIKELSPDVPVIVLSGMVGEEAATAVMKAGANDFVLKQNVARLAMVVAHELGDAAIRAERAALEEQLLLSDRLVQLGTLAAGVAHEINNPLTYVMGNIEYAMSELSSPVCASNVPAGVAGGAQGRVRRQLTHSRDDRRLANFLAHGRWAASPRPPQARAGVGGGHGVDQIRYSAKLVQDLEDVPPIAASENRLGQVFLNLLINAAQSIPAGNAEDHEIRLRLHSVGNAVQVEVSDTGVGIAREVRERLFQPFVTTKPKDIGTGLGLSICRKIVKEYGGEISAWANPDRGTTFRVSLPMREADWSRATRAHSSAPASRRGRVLVVDDEPEIVAMICRELCPEHDVQGATSVDEALQLIAAEHTFDVILCDLMMPEVDGIQLYRQLERQAPMLLERIVFMTGGPFTASARQFLTATPNLSIQKPFEPTALVAAVRGTIVRTSCGYSSRLSSASR